jgi:hypothetical protein
MLDTVSKPKAQGKLGILQWMLFALCFAGLLFLFVTGNVKALAPFLLAVSAVNLADIFVTKTTSPQQPVSLLGPREDPKPKFTYGPFFWLGLAFTLGAFMFIGRIRIAALLMMSGMFLMMFNRYKNIRGS